MRRFAILAGFAVLLGGHAASAAPCLLDPVDEAAARLNAAFERALAGLDDAGKAELEKAQTAWKKDRDLECKVDTFSFKTKGTREFIIYDKADTGCVLGYINARTAQLEAKVRGGAELRVSDPTPMVFFNGGHYAVSRVSHAQGKWYLEVTFDVYALSQIGDLSVFPAVGNGKIRTAKSLRIRRNLEKPGEAAEVQLGGMSFKAAPDTFPRLEYGLAIDADNQVAYSRSMGIWSHAAPGEPGGDALNPGGAYEFSIEGSSSLADLIRRGLVSINFGERTFTFPMPHGYRPFNQQ